jgi:transposase InsO family protein
VTLHVIRPGKPTENAHIESFNGTFRADLIAFQNHAHSAPA